jgi:uncharacterized membrane protein YsdA (DUF1294 family)
VGGAGAGLRTDFTPFLAAGYALLSTVALVLYGIDKRAATRGGRRIAESTLHWIALAGGWPGALLAQQMFRHKTQKRAFRQRFFLCVAANLALLAAAVLALGPHLR